MFYEDYNKEFILIFI